jgi:hypothetical protein
MTRMMKALIPTDANPTLANTYVLQVRCFRLKADRSFSIRERVVESSHKPQR